MLLLLLQRLRTEAWPNVQKKEQVARQGVGQAEAERSGPVGIADGAGCRGTAAAAAASEDWDGKARKGKGRWQTSEAGFSTGLDMFWHCGNIIGTQRHTQEKKISLVMCKQPWVVPVEMAILFANCPEKSCKCNL